MPLDAPSAATHSVALTINGETRTLEVTPWTTLLDLLRHALHLHGDEEGVRPWAVRACTVLVDGKRMNSCLKLAVMLDGASVTTVEGLAGADGTLHALQAAFIEHDAFQCGYCTPGQLCSAVALLEEGHATTRDEVRELMSGNLCRCGAYSNIVDAIESVRGMIRYEYARAGNLAEAISGAARAGAKVIAGGTNLVDLLKYDVERPAHLVDITRLPGLDRVEATAEGGLRIGALVTNSDLAYHPEVERRYPVLSRAILSGATPQLRNAATTGGNLLQRTRCYYFYDPATPCNKREPGAGCSAIGGVNRIHAVLGQTTQCIATHPSDMCVALAALEAVVHVEGPGGARAIPFEAFHRLPGRAPERDTTLEAGEIVVAVELPASGESQHYTYLKLRDRLSYAFALVSVAVVMTPGGSTRIALGGVAHKPWRVPEAEALLEGKPGSVALFEQVAERVMQGAAGQGGNDFKIPMAKKAIVRALQQAAAGTPQTVADKRIV